MPDDAPASDTIEDGALNDAVVALRSGQAVGMPTETVYGLAADAGSAEAVARIYALKGRPAHNPLIAHAADRRVAERIAAFNGTARALADRFWPGALTLVLPYGGEGVAENARAGLDTIAVRVPAHPVAHALLTAFGGPLVAPSANPSGRLSPTRAAHVARELPGVSIVLDGGASEVGLESTIVDCTEPRPVLLRAGGIPAEEIEALTGLERRANGAVKAPGALASHYAPRAALRLDAARAEDGEAWLGFGPDHPGRTTLSASGDLFEAARTLFVRLRELDATGTARIAVAPVPHHGLGLAINDRLRRAAAPRGEA